MTRDTTRRISATTPRSTWRTRSGAFPGWATREVYGELEFSMLLSLDPQKMAQLGITVDDVSAAVREQNATKPAGRLGREPSPAGAQRTLPVTTVGRLTEPSQFGNIIVRARPDGSRGAGGGPRPGPPGLAELRRHRPARRQGDRVPAGVCPARRQQPGGEERRGGPAGRAVPGVPGRGALADPLRYHALHHRLDRGGGDHAVRGDGAGDSGGLPLPPELARNPDPGARGAGERSSAPSSGSSCSASRSTLLTLFGLVLAIGIVVDDAIVVIENVERIMAEEHVSAREAANRAMRQVGGALVAIVLVLCSVFIPVAFIGGITGTMYKQFAITIVISVVLSGMVALTLTPALCALLLKHSTEGSREPLLRLVQPAVRLADRALHRRRWAGHRPAPHLARGRSRCCWCWSAVLFAGCRAASCPTRTRATSASRCSCPTPPPPSGPWRWSRRSRTILRQEPGVGTRWRWCGLDFLTGLQPDQRRRDLRDPRSRGTSGRAPIRGSRPSWVG